MPVTATTSSYDADRLASLRRVRRRATGLLLAVAAVFASTFAMGDAAWVGFLRTTAEASLVGGLADWFAVTALFRHPLGIPIPHTAIIPRSKEGLGQSLGAFVQENFLEPEHLAERIEEADVAARAGAWLSDPAHAGALAGQLVSAAGAVAEGLDQEAIEEEIERVVVERLRALPVAELSGRALQAAMAEGRHREVVTAAIEAIAAAMDDNRTALRRALGDESPWWVPEALDDAVFARAHETIQMFLGRLAERPDHDIRLTIDRRLSDFAGRLRTDPELAAAVQERFGDVVDHPALRAWARATWGRLAADLVEEADRPESGLRRRVATALEDLGRRLRDDRDLQGRVETWLRSMAPPLARLGRREIGDLISTTVDRWDTADTSRRLELWMGRDLQFVRINGTVVGGLAGLVIHTVVVLAGG